MTDEADAPTLAALAEEETVRVASRAVHEHLCRRNIMQYLDNDEDCEGIARAVIAALRRTPSPCAYADHDGLGPAR